MKMKRTKNLGRILFALAIPAAILFLGCGILQKPASTPAVPKAETSPVVSGAQQAAKEMTPSVPTLPSRPPMQPSQPAVSAPEKAAPPQEARPAPKAEEAAPESHDPLASGAVLLNPAAPDDAKTIQGRLAELGFYKAAVDGVWGKGSRAALRKFKQDRSLSAPDTWDKETQIALFKKGEQAGAATTGQDPLASGAVILDPSKPNDAQTIQGRLAELGLYKGGIDGIWGKGCRAALRAFKEKNGLPNPDRWDKETQMLLFKGASK